MLRTVRIATHGNLGRILRTNKTPFSTGKRGRSLVSVEPDVPKYPWVEQADPKGSGQDYFWNPETNETTHLGSPRPSHWVEVADPNGSGGMYWWNPETNQTTAVGEPRPNLFAGHSTVVLINNDAGIRPFGIGQTNLDVQRARQQQQQAPQSFGGTMVTYIVLGAGMTFGMVAVRAIFGF